MQDLNQPEFYLNKDKEDIAHELHKAGLHNVGQLIKSLFEKIEDLETEMNEAVAAAQTESYDNGYSDGQSNYQENNSNVEDFAHWFLTEFEPTHKKKIKEKTICGTNFIIMTENDYLTLKNQFHKMCD